MKKIIFSLLLLVIYLPPLQAAPMEKEDVPQPLQSWIPWVLHGEEKQLLCPSLYGTNNQWECYWPSHLKLNLKEKGGTFTQEWLMLDSGWIVLPGNRLHWPRDLKLNEKNAKVVEHNSSPGIHVDAGSYSIEGSFSWETLPEFLQVSPATALVSLTLNSKVIRIPDMDADGRVWLRKRGEAGEGGDQKQESRFEIRVFRRIIDEIPLMQKIRIELDVSGKPREILLGRGLPQGTLPLSLDTPLPARLEPDGRLRVQVRPGNWSIELTCRYPGPVHAIPLNGPAEPWPDEEVWVFDARNQLRLVEVEGVTPIDPQQTAMPQDWRNLPAYRVTPGESMSLTEKRRGDPDPAPDRLTLHRSLWLDFSGKGYTLQDQIQGTMTRGWRLEMSPPAELGQVTVDGRGQFITRLEETGKTGVEVRRGKIQLTADSRIEGAQRELPAVGWDHDFQQVSGLLHLPPGWRLFNASGVDEVPGTWLKGWTLLDLFVVLIIALSVFRLWGMGWGLLALVTLALTYHEFFSPRFVWLHILFAVALLRVLPAGKFNRIIKLYRNLSLTGLVLISLPFMVDQVRKGIYPQLERPWQTVTQRTAPATPVLMQEDAIEETMEGRPARAPMVKGDLYEAKEKLSSLYSKEMARTLQYDPKANIQTGPGLPHWGWTTIPLRWHGPVEKTQTIKVVLFPPWVNMILAFVRVLLLTALIFCVLEVRGGKGKAWAFPFKAAGQSALIFLVMGGLLLLPAPAEAEYPSKELLNELKVRLLEKPDCFPQCADSPRMLIEMNRDVLRARIEIHSLDHTAVPLPGSADQWLPDRILLNDVPARGLFKTRDGRIWIELPEGRHQIQIQGPLPGRSTVQIPLPLKPHRVETKLQGWVVEGIHENGLADNHLQFSRVKEEEIERELSVLEPETFPPLVRVERTLILGLDWEIHTRLVRMSPAGSAVVVEVPLLQGESVTSEQIRVVDGKALINMAPGTTTTQWSSVFEKQETLTLTAPETTAWIEVWRLDISPIWHADLSGIPVVHHQSQDRWLPSFRPWPGESMTLHITRPEGIPGKTFTVDTTRLTVTPGQRASDTILSMTVRSSQGGQHTLTLPEDVRLQSVSINNVQQPIRQEENRVTLPLVPGSQTMELQFQQPAGISPFYRTPAMDLGVESVNAEAHLNVPRNRWVLFAGGPELGPAVLFWGVVLVVIFLSLGLGRIPSTPLKTRHWLLLGLGLSAASVYTAFVVAAWFFAMGWRKNLDQDTDHKVFNTLQVGIGALTVMALSALIFAIQQGLLGYPDMQVSGNGSTAYLLRWYMDRSGAVLPQAWVVTVPMMVYRFLMLAWALWLAFALLRWLRWAWECFSTNGIWRTGRIIKPGDVYNPSHTVVPSDQQKKD